MVAWDGSSRLSARSGPDGGASYSYDRRGLLTGMVHDGAGEFTWEYNSAGEMKRMVGPGGGALTVDRETGGRVSRLTWLKHGQVRARHEYEYDLRGNITRWGDLRGDRQFGYDSANRLLGVTPQGEGAKDGPPPSRG